MPESANTPDDNPAEELNSRGRVSTGTAGAAETCLRHPEHSRAGSQSEKPIHEDVSNPHPVQAFARIANARERHLLVVLAWVVAVSMVLIKTYTLFYTDSLFSQRQIAYLSYRGPTFTGLDLVVVGATSLVVALLLPDIRIVVYGFFATILGSFTISFLYVFAYIWFALDYVRSLGSVPWGWEDAVFLAFVNVFRFIFPLGILCCLLGTTLGLFLKGIG
jgi:hypothetical protein